MTKTKLLLLAAALLPATLFPQSKSVSTKDRLAAFFKKAEQNGYSGSVLVARDTTVLLKGGYGWQDREKQTRETAETVFSIGSITKQFTAAAILKLEADGKLSVQDPIIKYFPEAPADKAEITIHQLLTHTSGFVDDIGDDYEAIDAKTYLKRAFASKLRFLPGERYRYSNTGYSILGILVEKISGKGYEDFLYQNFWHPAGMEHTGYIRPGFKPEQLATGYQDGIRWGTALDRPWMPDGPGWNLRANGGVLSTVGDLYRWYLALQKDKIFEPVFRQLLYSPYVKECYDCDSYYGYGWSVLQTNDGKTLVSHNGGNGVYNAYMGFVLQDSFCMILSSNSSDKITDSYARKTRQILSGKDQPVPDSVVQKYTGTWHLPGSEPVGIRFDELDHLVASCEDSTALLTLSGDGQENEYRTGKFRLKTGLIMAESRSGKGEELAKAMEITPEAAMDKENSFWKNHESRYGKWVKTEAVGAVIRPARNACLIFIRVVFEHKTRYLTFVWADNRLSEIRQSDTIEKEFDLVTPKHFFAANNKLALFLDDNNTVVLQDKHKKETTLKR